MKAWFAESGALILRETPKPAPREGEALIRVAAAGVNRADVFQIEGRYPPPEGVANIPGLEVSGHIEALGPATSGWKKGDAVCGLLAGGGYAEYAVAPQEQLLPAPASLTLQEAAALPETLFTCWLTMIEEAGLAPGERFLVHGGGSGIGTMAIQLAAWRGARVFATARQREKCELCRSLGAEAFLEPEEDFVAGIDKATGGRGVDVILDMVGGSYIPRNFKAAATGGRIVQIAFLGGTQATPPLGALLMKRLTWRGSTLRSRSVTEKGALRDALLREVWPAVAQGRIRPLMRQSFAFGDAEAAVSAMKSNLVIGKTVLSL